jgi:hypothetical protein
MIGGLVERLHSSTPSSEDIEAIRSLPLFIKQVEAHHFVVRDGQRPTHCCLVAAGFCVPTKTTGHGKRQMLSIHERLGLAALARCNLIHRSA